MGDGEKLLTYLNSALKALLEFDIFPRVPKKSEILLPSVIIYCRRMDNKSKEDGAQLLRYKT